MEDKRDGFVVIREFMWRELGLAGVPLLVFARAYGFCQQRDGLFYESKARTASFFGVSERTVFRAIRELVGLGLIEEVGTFELGSGRRTKAYRICQVAKQAPEAEGSYDLSSPEETYSSDSAPYEDGATSDDMTPRPLTDCHPIHKRDNKNF